MNVAFVTVCFEKRTRPFGSVCPQVSSFPASLQLLSILQSLLALKPDRPAVWMALETVTNRAILLAEDGESVRKQRGINTGSTQPRLTEN